MNNDLIESIKTNKEKFKTLDKQGVKNLFEQILMSQKPSSGIRILEDVGLLKIYIPELQKCVGFDQRNPHHNYDVFDHILAVLDNTPLDLTLRWAALLHDIAKPQTFFVDEKGKGRFFGHDIEGAKVAKDILNRLDYDERFSNEVAVLIKAHMSRYNNMKEKGVKKLINKVGKYNIEKLFQLQRADIKGRHGPYDFSRVEVIENMAKEIIDPK